MKTVTLSQVRAWNACPQGVATVLSFLEHTPADDEPIPLTAVLDASPDDLADICWVLARLDRPLLVQWVVDCAEAAVLEAEPTIIALEVRNPAEDRPRAALTAASELIATLRSGGSLAKIKQLREKARAYASSATYAAVHAADAYGASVAYAAACACAATVAKQKMRGWCRERLRAYLEGHEPGPVAL